MLAAAPNRTSALTLFEVVLRAVDPQVTQVSDPLRAHAIEVLRQAILVAADPRVITADTAREAIELAIRLRDNQALTQRLSSMPAITDIAPELAKDLLSSLQPLAA